jgi:heme O synthase-like polyprenyltransferase
VLTIALSALVSFGSVQGMRLTFFAAELDARVAETPWLNSLTVNPEAFAAAQRAHLAATRSALVSMRWPRVIVLFLLSSAAGVVLATALRLRWPSGIPRVVATTLLGRAALVAAIIRTLDGAQDLVIARAGAAAYEKTLADNHIAGAEFGASLLLFSIFSIINTIAVAGLFIAARNYFRSDRVLQTFALLDRAPPGANH